MKGRTHPAKAEVDRRRARRAADFFTACARGDAGRLRELLAADPSLARLAEPLALHRRVDRLYRLLKARQLAAAEAALAGAPAGGGIDFVEDLYSPFYGGRQFSVRDPNGYTLVFLQPG